MAIKVNLKIMKYIKLKHSENNKNDLKSGSRYRNKINKYQ